MSAAILLAIEIVRLIFQCSAWEKEEKILSLPAIKIVHLE